MLKNFPFKIKNSKTGELETWWWSRSCAVTALVFCRKYSQGHEPEWCILANKRGKGCPDFVGDWSAPCGYLDCNETLIAAARREVLEETGISLDKVNLISVGVQSDPVLANKQNVTHRFMCILPGCTEDYDFGTSLSEPDEVDGIKFIPIREINQYTWAFGHKKLIKQVFENHIDISWFKRWIRDKYLELFDSYVH